MNKKTLTIMNKKTILTSLLSSLFIVTSAYGNDERTFTQGGFQFEIFNATVPEVFISDAGRNVPLPISADSTLVIPSSVTHGGKSYAVGGITKERFMCRPEIKHLMISEGVEEIGSMAFTRCTNLESLQLPSTYYNGNEHVDAFNGCSRLRRITINGNEDFDSRDNSNAIIRTRDNTLLYGCLGTQIPSTVTTIAQYAFNKCDRLERIVIPEGVKTICHSAFRDCTNLKEVSLPNSLDSIGGCIFFNCMSLESIVIPQNVSKIDSRLFGGCYSLKEVKVDKRNRTFDSRNNCNAIIHTETDCLVAGCVSSVISNGIKAIGSTAFAHVPIQRIRIPRSVTRIGEEIFRGCSFINEIVVDPGNPVYNSKDNCNAIIETATAKLLHGCGTSTIPDGIKEIGDHAFNQIPMPRHLVIPEGVEVIGKRAFSWTHIQYAKFPSTLKLIGEGAFSFCNSLSYVDLSRCSADIGIFAFWGCESLHVVDFSPTIGDIHKAAFNESPCNSWVKEFVERRK